MTRISAKTQKVIENYTKKIMLPLFSYNFKIIIPR